MVEVGKMNCPKCGSEMHLTTWVQIYPKDGWWCNNCKYHSEKVKP